MAGKKLQPTEERADDQDADPDGHRAVMPKLSMDDQQEKLRDNEIWGFHCDGCGYDQFSPMARCPKCRKNAVSTRQFSTTGTIVSYTIQSVAAEQYMNEVPFAFAIIQLDDGPRISGWVAWISKREELPIGQAVEFVSSYKPGMQFEKR